MPTLLLPDIEQAVIAHLAADTDIQAITDTVRADILGPYPMLRAMRTGGTPERRLDHALLFIDAYGDVPSARPAGERGVLNLLARTAVRVLVDLEGQSVGDCDVSAVIPVVVMQWLPDPLTDQGRYHNVVAIHARTRK